MYAVVAVLKTIISIITKNENMNSIILKTEKNEAMPYDTLLCGVCSHDNKIALTVNEVKVCYDCLNFNKYRAKGNGLTEMQQLKIDTNYISLNAT